MYTTDLLPEMQDPGIRRKVYDDWMRGLSPARTCC